MLTFVQHFTEAKEKSDDMKMNIAIRTIILKVKLRKLIDKKLKRRIMK
jgi:hypothetical protein